VGRFSASDRIVVTGDADGVVRVGPVSGGGPHLLLGQNLPEPAPQDIGEVREAAQGVARALHRVDRGIGPLQHLGQQIVGGDAAADPRDQGLQQRQLRLGLGQAGVGPQEDLHLRQAGRHRVEGRLRDDALRALGTDRAFDPVRAPLAGRASQALGPRLTALAPFALRSRGSLWADRANGQAEHVGLDCRRTPGDLQQAAPRLHGGHANRQPPGQGHVGGALDRQPLAGQGHRDRRVVGRQEVLSLDVHAALLRLGTRDHQLWLVGGDHVPRGAFRVL
jgi:hypothetical protein